MERVSGTESFVEVEILAEDAAAVGGTFLSSDGQDTAPEQAQALPISVPRRIQILLNNIILWDIAL